MTTKKTKSLDFKITAAMLEKAGYRSSSARHKGEYCTALYQKTVRGGPGDYPGDTKKLYFINFYLWDFTRAPAMGPTGHKSVSVECRMYTEKASFDLDYFVERNDTISKIEKFYADAYVRMGCVPDKHNN